MGSTNQPGDSELTDFVRAELPNMLGLARLLSQSESDAEDLVQGALVRAVAKWNAVSAAENRPAYMRRLLINFHNSQMRRKRVKTVPLSERSSATGDTTDQIGGREDLISALQELSPKQRRVVVLKYYLNLSAEEIGADLGMRPSSVRSALTRSLHVLRESRFLTQLQEERRERTRA